MPKSQQCGMCGMSVEYFHKKLWKLIILHQIIAIKDA